MNWFTGFVLFFIMWWTVLFAVLPLGVRPDESGQDTTGGWRGAPREVRLGRKALITTAITAVLWLAFYGAMQLEWFGFREGIFAIQGD
ncbi:DUF1467 family protein [Rhodovarius lipocyclicus]|uniref:DUF1467 family protein n=1 Tax=Rhodovarius lipocyclicus TaxID=268410 RepID=UPI00135C9709|nr:DUF1467 family protein [Rhodovarius lipocyclicus]